MTMVETVRAERERVVPVVFFFYCRRKRNGKRGTERGKRKRKKRIMNLGKVESLINEMM